MTTYSDIDQKAISALARTYNILEYEVKLKSMLRYVIGEESILKSLSKFKTHELINDILIENHQGENTLKAKLVEIFISQNVVAAFELRVNKSRVDFLSINGDSKSFEIKSKLDNLRKLKKQTQDYEKVFEYNYIVINEKHHQNALDLIPDHYGVIILENHNLIKLKESALNTNLDSSIQLNLLTKKDRLKYFGGKNGDVFEILKNYSPNLINELFKQALKDKYKKKWDFLVRYNQEILPIDYQFFFNHNIEPSIIYKA